MSLSKIQAEDRRLIILRALEDGGFSAGEAVLKQVVEQMGHRPAREQIRADLAFLAENNLVRLEKLPALCGELWVAHLLPDGQDVAKGRAYPGVARREPG